MTRNVRIALSKTCALAALLLLGPAGLTSPAESAESHTDAPKRAYFRCFGDQPALDLLITRLDHVLAEYPNSHVVDDVLFAKGRAYRSLRRFTDAKAILQTVIDEFPISTKMPESHLWSGGPHGEQEIEIALRLAEHQRQFPTLTRDHALLELYGVHRRSGDRAAAVHTLTRLVSLYPKGDHVDEDRTFIDGLIRAKLIDLDELRKPKRYRSHSPLKDLQRPHLSALWSLAVILEKQDRSKEATVLYKQLLGWYGDLLGPNTRVRIETTIKQLQPD